MRRNGGQGPSQRQLKVGERIRHLLSEDLKRGEVHDPRLSGVSVTIAEVRVSPDLKHATVFAAELGRPLEARTQEALQHAAPYLSGRLGRRMSLKYVPRLHFVADETFEEAARIGRLIAEERAAQEVLAAEAGPGGGRDESDEGHAA